MHTHTRNPVGGLLGINLPSSLAFRDGVLLLGSYDGIAVEDACTYRMGVIQPKVVHVDVGQRGPGGRGGPVVPNHGDRGGRPSGGVCHYGQVVHVIGGRRRPSGDGRLQEPFDAGADAAGRIPARVAAPVHHVAQAGAARGICHQRRRNDGPCSRPGLVSDRARSKKGPGRQHGFVFHQQNDASRQTRRSRARFSYATVAGPFQLLRAQWKWRWWRRRWWCRE